MMSDIKKLHCRLAIVTTHPIQYYAPLFQILHGRGHINLRVYYTCGESYSENTDPGFGKKILWNIQLLEGYPYEFVDNTSKSPGSHHYRGIVNPSLIERISAWEPDALLIFGWSYQSHLQAMRYFKNKVPVLFRGDSTLLDEQPLIKRFIRECLLRWVYRKIDYALHPGTQTKAYFKRFGIKDSQLIYAPHAVDNERFALPQHARAEHLRKSLHLGENDILILYAGKFEEKKDPLLLIRAFLEVNTPQNHLLLVGNGILEAEIKRHSASHNRIHFLDFQNQLEMPAIYQAADLFCLPSRGPNETWGLAVNEAMACGKAILVSDRVGCAIDLVMPGINGEIFKSGDLEDLKIYMSQMTTSKAALAEYGRRSYEFISKWNFKTIADTVEKLLLHETN